jgi:diguanylate cyclase (GGDEF)-like protein/PAS domain S-box-containing protein
MGEEAEGDALASLHLVNSVLAQTTLPFLLSDLAGNVMWANAAFERLVGYSTAELRGSGVRAITPPQWHALDQQHLRSLLEHSKPIEGEKEYRGKDGRIIPVSFIADIYHDERGEARYLYAFVTDISERKRNAEKLAQAQSALRQSEEQLRTTFESAAIGIVIVSPGGMPLKVNRAICQMLGYTEQEMLRPVRNRTTHPEDQPAEMQFRSSLLAGKIRDYQFDCRAIRKDGRVIYTRRTVTLVRDAEGAPRHMICEVQDITERRRLERELEMLSITDPLTGVANRRRFDEVRTAEWRRAMRTNSPLSIAMIDVDNFKLYNDHYGHIGGDNCLRLVAAALARTVRQDVDLVARYGGEEFVIVMPGADYAATAAAAERARAAVADMKEPHAAVRNGVVTVSVGFANIVPKADNFSDLLIAMADSALYEAKGAGRNRVSGRQA